MNYDIDNRGQPNTQFHCQFLKSGGRRPDPDFRSLHVSFTSYGNSLTPVALVQYGFNLLPSTVSRYDPDADRGVC